MDSLISAFVAAALAFVTASSAAITPKLQVKIPVIQNVSPEVTKQVTLNPTIAADKTEDKKQPGMVVIDDVYDYMGKTEIKVTFPKNGGDVKGTFSGFCKGTVSGNYAGGDNGKISGEAFAKCSIGPITNNVEGTYSGIVSFKDQKIYLTVDFTSPKIGRFYPTLNFSN